MTSVHSGDGGGRLARQLRRAVRGEVRFDDGSRALYANDASIYRQVPIGVVIPRDAGDVIRAVAVCRRYDVPILARGCGTGLAGQSVNRAVVFDFSKYMNRIVALDPDQRTARVQPGVICDQLRTAASRHGLTFAPDPATHDRCTLGGMIGNNSCGTHSVLGGKTVDNVLTLDVLTYDGLRMTVGPTSDGEYRRILRHGGRRADLYRRLRALRDRYADRLREFPDIPRRVSGYNLDDLLPEKGFNVARALVGSESTCVLVLAATVRLVEDPARHALLVVGYPDAATAADHLPDLLDTGVIGLECFDTGVLDNLARHGEHIPGMDELPPGGSWLLAEYGAADQDDVGHQVEAARRRVRPPGQPKVFEDEQGQAEVWEVRRSAIEYTRIPGQHAGLAGWEDAAVPPDRLGDYIRGYCELVARHGYHTVLFGHFGQGCMHNRLDLDLETADGVANFRRFLTEAADLVVRHGGSLSGEHGDGQLRGALLRRMYGAETVEAFREFKRIWDPRLAMNPGKVVDPYAPDQNLRQGPGYRPRQVDTYFRYPADERGFSDAVNRCFGIGKCRHTSGGTMCPSFMVTREEQHSTRGRARLLSEMMSGHLAGGPGWRDEHVKGALDLCLSCKGCKGDCPVNVDMASYKAEFLAHYYHRRLRPRAAYTLGLIGRWAPVGSRLPGTANALLHTPLLSRALKYAAGIHPARQAPELARRSFRAWFARRGGSTVDGPPVLLWPDTFTDHFSPEIAADAVMVLEAAGFRVRLPDRPLCCGRPLYDYGMLPTARRWLRRILDELREPVSAGVPLVGLEPSCLAVFRDELPNLFPDDADARRLSRQSLLLSEFLRDHAPDFAPPLRRRALVQVHCHHTAVAGDEAERSLLDRMGVRAEYPDSGCCGMAGSFGYERGEKYRVSRAAGERVLLPAVRAADPDTIILADGFSCREQIAQATDRRALHLAQLLALALRHGPAGPVGPRPERHCPPRPARAATAFTAAAGLVLAGASVAAVTARRRAHR